MGPLRVRVRDIHWRVASRMPLRARRHYLYTVGTRRLGRFDHPVTFGEKVQWRILHDRRPDLVRACDKLAMKDMARERVPGPELRIPRTIWYGTDLSDAPDLTSIGPWVLKPNHGSGDVILGPPAPAGLEGATRAWLRSKPAELLGEWGYTQARPLLLLEERIGSPGEKSPADYKVHVHDGIPRFIQVTTNRATTPTMTFYDPDWTKLDIVRGGNPQVDVPRPDNLDDVLQLASRLAAGWDFMRVDMYLVGHEIWFGEFSPYPGGGVGHLKPSSSGYELGRYWILPRIEDVSG